MRNTPYKGRRMACAGISDFTLYILTVALFVVVIVCTCKYEHDLKLLNSELNELSAQFDELEEQIDILKETIGTKPKKVVVDKTEYRVEVTKISQPELYTDEDAVVLAKMLWGEARGVKDLEIDETCVSSECQQAAVIWTALNRYDAGYSDSIASVVTAPKQFVGYRESNPVDEELMDLVMDVLDRWNKEQYGETDVGRVLPADYMWFYGDGKHNHFRNKFKTTTRWAWELEDIYEG